MRRPRPRPHAMGYRRSARLEALEASKAAAAAAAATSIVATTAPPVELGECSSRRRGRKKQKSRSVEDVVVNSVEKVVGETRDYKRPTLEPSHKGHQSKLSFSSPVPKKQILEHALNILQGIDNESNLGEGTYLQEVEHHYGMTNYPLDCVNIRAKIEGGEYGSLEQFQRDVLTAIKKAFNETKTISYQEACQIRDISEKIFSFLRTGPDSHKQEEFLKLRRSRSAYGAGSGHKLAEVGSPNPRLQNPVLGFPPNGRPLAIHAHDGRRRRLPLPVPFASNPFSGKRQTLEDSSDSRGGTRPIVSEGERRFMCKPYTSFLSTDEATASAMYSSRPAPLLPVNNYFNYRESLMKFSKNLGTRVQDVVRRKLQELELRKRAQMELACKAQEQRALPERQMLGNVALKRPSPDISNMPLKFPATLRKVSAGNATPHQSINTDATSCSYLPAGGMPASTLDFSWVNMATNQYLPPDMANNQLAQGEFPPPMVGNLQAPMGEYSSVTATLRVPPSDPSSAFSAQQGKLFLDSCQNGWSGQSGSAPRIDTNLVPLPWLFQAGKTTGLGEGPYPNHGLQSQTENAMTSTNYLDTHQMRPLPSLNQTESRFDHLMGLPEIGPNYLYGSSQPGPTPPFLPAFPHFGVCSETQGKIWDMGGMAGARGEPPLTDNLQGVAQTPCNQVKILSGLEPTQLIEPNQLVASHLQMVPQPDLQPLPRPLTMSNLNGSDTAADCSHFQVAPPHMDPSSSHGRFGPGSNMPSMMTTTESNSLNADQIGSTSMKPGGFACFDMFMVESSLRSFAFEAGNEGERVATRLPEYRNFLEKPSPKLALHL